MPFFEKDFFSTKPAAALKVAAGLFILFIIAYWNSLADLVHLWNTNETYSHGYIIPLIAAILIYRQNNRLKHVALDPSVALLIPLIGTLIIWFLAVITDTKVIELTVLPFIYVFAFMSMIGLKASRLIFAATLYLIYATPVWDLTVPLLQDIATYVNEFALRLLGLPILIEDTTVTTPAGSFEIEGGCSGVRYLIVTLALGTYYGLTHYKKVRNIIVLLAFSVLLPALSNWIRIYIIILAGHYSDMKSSLVGDHIWFGWVLYGISLIPLFYIARYIQKYDQENNESEEQEIDQAQATNNFKRNIFIMPIILIISISLFTNILKNREPKILNDINQPLAMQPWIGPIYSNGWQPHYQNASIEKHLLYLGQENQPDISLHIYYYAKQSQDSELINEFNTIADYHHIKHQQVIRFQNHDINENVLELPNGEFYLVWYWFNVNSENIAKPIFAKWYQALELLKGKATSSLIAVSIKCDNQCNNKKESIKKFLVLHGEKINESLKLQDNHAN